MIAVDTNILVYAHREDSPFHEAAFRRMEELAEGRATWTIPCPCLHEFLAIVTHPRIYAPPTPLRRALSQVDAWLESPTLVLLAEAQEFWKTLRGLIEAGRVSGAQVHDARVAALCTPTRCARAGSRAQGGKSAARLRRDLRMCSVVRQAHLVGTLDAPRFEAHPQHVQL